MRTLGLFDCKEQVVPPSDLPRSFVGGLAQLRLLDLQQLTFSADPPAELLTTCTCTYVPRCSHPFLPNYEERQEEGWMSRNGMIQRERERAALLVATAAPQQ